MERMVSQGEALKRRKAVAVGLRSRLPLVMRWVALALIVAGIVFIGISYYKHRNEIPFMNKPQNTQLSSEVVSEVNGYERRVTDGDRLRMLVKAAKDIAYADGHHELEEVSIESYSEKGGTPDKIRARRSISDADNAVITFTGDVNVETANQLKTQSEKIVYDQKAGTAKSEGPMTFAHENVSGSSNSGNVDTTRKNLSLNGNVEIVVKPDNKADAKSGKNSERAEPIIIHSAQAEFDHGTLHLSFSGGATAEQGSDIMSGDNLNGSLNEQKKLQKLEVRNNSYLRTTDEGHAAEIHSKDMDFYFTPEQKLERAVATGDVQSRSLNADSQFELSGSNVLNVNFIIQDGRSLLKEMHADGRTVVKLAAPRSHASDPRAANKQLTADSVNLFWRSTGKDLEKADAIGNAELIVDPVQKNDRSEKKTLTAARFNCFFFDTGNLAEKFIADENARAVIEPLQAASTKGRKTLTARKMTAVFDRTSQDVERFDAEGEAKFNQLDKNGVANTISYEAAANMARLRGGEPTVWDAKARTKAMEIDSDLGKDVSYGRGKTSTTYYSQEQTGGATPFSNVKSPVNCTADRSEFKHDDGVAIYTGNARLWQDDNFVRGEKITIIRDSKRMEAIGHIQSALYQARQRNKGGGESVVPVFGSSDSMWYSDTDRQVHYQNNVDIRQGTDRVTSGVADVYLLKDKGEVERMIAQNDVVLVQPNRRGTGKWAEYTSADDTMVIKGNPAVVEDAEQGRTQSGRLTVYLGQGRVVADDERGAQSPGRVHSTHRVRKQ